MKNKEQKIVRLLEEGFSYDTIKKMNDYHLNKIYKKLVNEEETSTVQKTTYSKSEVQQMKDKSGGLNVNGTVTPNDDGSVTVTQEMGEEMTEDNDLDKSVEKESGFNPYAGNSPGNTEGPAGNNPSPNSDGMGYIDEEAVIEALFGNSNKKMKTPITTLGMFEETNEGTKCWKGYEKKGMKTMFGKRVPNCVKKESREEKVSQIEESILSLIKKSQGKMLTKKDDIVGTT